MNRFPTGARALAPLLAAAGLLAGCAAPAPPKVVEAAAATAPDAAVLLRVAEIEGFALRLREADRAELIEEWRLAIRSAQPARTALLRLHPLSPVYDPDGAVALLEELSAEERRAVLRGWVDIVGAVRQGDLRAREQAERAREQAERAREQLDRAREQLAAQAERQRTQLREADRRALDERARLDQERVRTETERQRADALAARLEELQRTMQALRDIDRRQINRTP